ncbi:MAG TPA: ABC transporter permease [Acidimicrobiales bacterium]|nr:ABC transporter permease [Acidimicrobiales bacterium]
MTDLGPRVTGTGLSELAAPVPAPAAPASAGAWARPLSQDERVRALRVTNAASRTGCYALLGALIVAGAVAFPQFLTVANLDNIVSQATPVALLALGQTFALIAGEIDLSVGSIVSLTSVILANLMASQNSMILPIVALAVAIGVGVGVVNAALVVLARIPSFIVTLAMMLILEGANLLWTSGGPASNLAPGFAGFAVRSFGGIPIGLPVLLVATLGTRLLLRRSASGRELYLVGGNRRAAIAAGVRTGRVLVWAFALSALGAVLGGIFETSYEGSGQSFLGSGMELSAIAAAVIGGTSLFGGRGEASNALGGALVLGVIFDLLTMSGVPVGYESVATGAILVLGLMFHARLERGSGRVAARLVVLADRLGGRRPRRKRPELLGPHTADPAAREVCSEPSRSGDGGERGVLLGGEEPLNAFGR